MSSPKVQIGSHSASFSVGTGSFAPLLKWPGRETSHSPPYSTDLGLFCKSAPPYSIAACTVTILPSCHLEDLCVKSGTMGPHGTRCNNVHSRHMTVHRD